MLLTIFAVNVVYILSLITTIHWYPEQPIYDLETDKIIGYYEGIQRKHFMWLVAFWLIEFFGYKSTSRAKMMGVQPGWAFDMFGLTLLTQFLYSFSNKSIYLLYIAPAYGTFKLAMLIRQFCCGSGIAGMMGLGGMGGKEKDEEPQKSNR